MKNLKNLFSLCLVLRLNLGSVTLAAPVAEATIDTSRTGSLDIYKYDFTGAAKDGVWDNSYVSTGVYDQAVNDTLGGAVRAGDSDNTSDLGNGEKSYGYAIQGVEFTYLKVGEIVQFTESTADGATSNHVEVLYGIDKTKGADLLSTLGLANGAGRYENADKSDKLDHSCYYYQSGTLITALRNALTANATTVKNALESYGKANGGTALPLTDGYGHTSADGLPLGLYLVVETKVPEMVIDTTSPFFVSLPMTSVDGNNATDGGTRWMYDVTLYPKNETGIPTLEKTLRENKDDTGKNNGSSEITDSYAHTGTASDGDVIDYQLISTLPSITSESTYLTCYTFVDTLSKGLSYNKNDVVLEFFRDAACTQSVARWTEADGKFTVTYNTTAEKESVMTVEMTAAGLAEINTSKAVYTDAGMVNSGYSDCTLRITYAAALHSDASVTYGDTGNPNDVVLTWKRTSSDYYDTLVDDAHVYAYGLELTKLFSDGKGDLSKVEFLLHNDTDNYFVKATLNKAEGIYYVTDHVEAEADATHFIPMSADPNQGKIVVKGLEDDTYTLTEVQTANGYTLLKENIQVVISQAETTTLCNIYASDILGLIQNDPRYATIIHDTGDLHNMPQKHLEHHLLTASATVDGNAVTMLTDNGSANAEAPLKVVNTPGFDLPRTGDNGTRWLTIAGTLLILCAGSCIGLLIDSKRKKNTRQ